MSLTFIHAVMRATFSQFVAVSLGYFRANFDSALSPFSETSKKKMKKKHRERTFFFFFSFCVDRVMPPTVLSKNKMSCWASNLETPTLLPSIILNLAPWVKKLCFHQ